MRPRTIVLVVLFLAVCSAVAFALTRRSHAPEPSRAAERTRSATAVSGLRVSAQPVRETLALTGSVLAFESVALQPEMTGKVTGIYFEEGAEVAAGTVLVQLNNAEPTASLERARHRLRIAQDREARLHRLIETSSISQEDYDRALNEMRVAQADIAVIEAHLEKSRIVAPYDGVVGLRQVSLGSLVGSGDLIAQLQVIDRVKLEFAVPERHRAVIHPGLVVRFRVAGIGDWFEATVYAVEPAVDFSTRTMSVRAVGENPDRRLLPGSFAEISLPLLERPDGLLVPTIAVVSDAQRNVVFVCEEGRAQPRTVATGMRFSNEILVLEGLAPGEVVITSGLTRLRAGMPVEVNVVN